MCALRGYNSGEAGSPRRREDFPSAEGPREQRSPTGESPQSTGDMTLLGLALFTKAK